MGYSYRILVVDDEQQIEVSLRSYAEALEAQELQVTFDTIRTYQEYQPSKPYDILMVDYDLKGFSQRFLKGNEFIQEFRRNNKVSKVIFYSSSFDYDTENMKYDFPFKDKAAFDLINVLQVDRVAAKNNYDMMVSMISDCCRQLDVVSVALYKVLTEHQQEGIDVTYMLPNGAEVGVRELLDDLARDTDRGRLFRRQISETLLKMILQFKF